jgi:FSR family fosmidomycin resistance protein-like MFS transporter
VAFADEFVDGAKGAALPAIQHSLSLGYGQIGLLSSVPLLVGGLLELPVGLARRRRLVTLAGGAVFVLAVAGVAFARNFAELLVALTLFFPASGAFVSLTQASLMDALPDQRARAMARWDQAGWAGALCGPLLLAAVIAIGGGWRDAYLVLAGLCALVWIAVVWIGVAWLGVLCTRPLVRQADAGHDADAGASNDGADEPAGWARMIAKAARSLILLQVADLLVDVLTGFAAVYLVDVVHATLAVAALAITLRLGAGLAGDALLVAALNRFSDRTILRATAIAAAPLYPAFLLVPGLAAKLAALALLSAVTAVWYPLLQARLYDSVPSSVAVTLSSVASMAGAAGPLVVGIVAQACGLTWALAGLAVVPIVIFAGSPLPSVG